MGRKGNVLTKANAKPVGVEVPSAVSLSVAQVWVTQGDWGCHPGVSGLEGGRPLGKQSFPKLVQRYLGSRWVRGGTQLCLSIGVLVPPGLSLPLKSRRPSRGQAEQGLWKVTRCFQDKRQVSGRWVLRA